ncbi:hypothetical protein GPALN_002181 [Globodera pallida]|nr:hypothetical protein GPALN_002181 [Globodera pallida]
MHLCLNLLHSFVMLLLVLLVLVAMWSTPCSAGVAAPLRMKRQDWFSGSMMSARGAGSGGWDLFGGR